MEDVGGRFQLDGPRVSALVSLRSCCGGRTVVGDGSGHQDKIGVCVSASGVEHLGRGRRFHDAHTARRGNRKVRGEQRHVRAALARFLRKRNPHSSGRAVADEPHGINRFARPTGRHEHPHAPKRVRFTEQRACAGVDLFRLGHPTDSELSLRGLPFVGTDELDAPGAKRLDVRARCGMGPHPRVHRGREENRAAMRERRFGDEVVGQPMRELRKRVRRRRRDDE